MTRYNQDILYSLSSGWAKLAQDNKVSYGFLAGKEGYGLPTVSFKKKKPATTSYEFGDDEIKGDPSGSKPLAKGKQVTKAVNVPVKRKVPVGARKKKPKPDPERFNRAMAMIRDIKVPDPNINVGAQQKPKPRSPYPFRPTHPKAKKAVKPTAKPVVTKEGFEKSSSFKRSVLEKLALRPSAKLMRGSVKGARAPRGYLEKGVLGGERPGTRLPPSNWQRFWMGGHPSAGKAHQDGQPEARKKLFENYAERLRGGGSWRGVKGGSKETWDAWRRRNKPHYRNFPED
jgi:hypothetical protein